MPNIDPEIEIYRETKTGEYYYGHKINKNDVFIITVVNADEAFKIVARANAENYGKK